MTTLPVSDMTDRQLLVEIAQALRDDHNLAFMIYAKIHSSWSPEPEALRAYQRLENALHPADVEYIKSLAVNS